MDFEEKLSFLADAARHDLSCACGTKDNDDHRRRGENGLWLYPASAARGGKAVMLKTLVGNACVNDCAYCPFRASRDTRRAVLSPDELARAFIRMERRMRLFGLFLTTGVERHPDHALGRVVATAEILRQRYRYRGFLHLKIVPGASDAAVERAVSVASAVSLNIETPSARHMSVLAPDKRYDEHVLGGIERLHRLTAKGGPYARVKQTTQFLVGASDETDGEIVRSMGDLYKRLKLQRIYFSAYQRGEGQDHLPGENRAPERPDEPFVREHRLYQTDFLMRQYGFSADEIPLERDGRLSLDADPKERWAQIHPEFFPVRLNKAPRRDLLRVPGLGPVTVRRILGARKERRLRSFRDIGLRGTRAVKAEDYVVFEG